MDVRARSVKWQVRMLEQQLQQPQQSEESSSLLQNDSSTHPPSQQQPQERAEEYISDTFTYIETVKDFCDTETAWTRQRESEIEKMRDIKSRADKLFICFKIKKLKKELGEVLTNTRKGLNELQPFLDAVERLAVTSPFVFMDKSFPLRGKNAEAVRSVVSAKIASPLLIHFKRDDGAFFLPELDSVELLVHQLTNYVCIIKWICKEMKTKDKSQVTGNQEDPSQLSLSTSLSMENVPNLSQLSRIRMEESFRLTFLVNDQEFAKMYNQRHSEMSELLSSLENNAVGLDRIKYGYSVLTIIGSFLGILGGILSIVSLFTGLAMFPAAILLTFKRIGGLVGIFSGTFYMVTALVDFLVNKDYVELANNNINNFTKHRQNTVDCLKLAASHHHAAPQLDQGNMGLGFMKVMSYFRAIFKSFDTFVDGAVVVEQLDFFKLSTYIFFGGNAIAFLIDLFSFGKESWNIVTRKKSKAAQLIRSNTGLWHSEIEAWKRIHDCLFKGEQVFWERMVIVETE
ncbi:hypothetical protein MHYP_G00146360 [Metynnis hypsauchen]